VLVPPDDAPALADAMDKLAREENLRDDFGRAGRIRIEQEFTIEKTIEPLLERFAALPL
jgi:glycosyltransferase involved in cell wall biosynthesis